MDKKHLTGFPFSAVLNADAAKRAIMCLLVGNVRTVLIQGVSGTAKTTLVRSIPGIFTTEIVNLPLNASEGQVIGTLDIEETVKKGERRVLQGLISRANGNILYADDANLLDRAVLSTVLKAAKGEEVLIEREGMSYSYRSDLKFIATMNTLEGPMDRNLMDMFDICVKIADKNNEEERYTIVRRKMEFDDDPKGFRKRYEDEDERTSSVISKAIERIAFVTISDELMKVAAELCTKVGAEGYRGDIALIDTSVSLAAIGGRDEVSLEDVKEAAGMCLSHRVTEMPPKDEERGQDRNDTEQNPSDAPRSEGKNIDNADGGTDDASETIFSVGDVFSVIDFTSLTSPGEMNARSYGRHGKTRSNGGKGRYVRSRISREMTDLALDASIRAAAPYQSFRKKDGLMLVLEPGDLRQKVRERKSGASVMFLVDASGSMGARKRMVSVKGAVFSLLRESYKNRDKVGLTAFRRDKAEVLLPFTKSVDFAYRKLKELPTGGTTPLAAALLKAYTEIKKERRSHPNERYYVVLTTDGRANIAMNNGDPFSDALTAARYIGNEEIASWIVVDTGTGFPHTDNALKICSELNGTYLKLEELSSDVLAHRIKTIVDNRGRA